ncbi:TPA: hypothetical protein PTW06_003677 [Clostridium botulinum]|nr:hypothetical protein [Clostridium botulinum]HDK7226244.1 hypothetical protein [Clostridium botulinum]HDK7273737.1 hypothetical protein [Clostridium botulinum]HDK7307085.1 hypothetical protein [Clostridium botulinum]
MVNKDLFNSIKVVEAKTDTSIDTAGFSSLVFAVIATGAATAKLYEGDTTESLTEVKEDDYLGNVINADGAGVYKVGYRGNKRYIAIKLTGTGTTAIGILGHANLDPVK